MSAALSFLLTLGGSSKPVVEETETKKPVATRGATNYEKMVVMWEAKITDAERANPIRGGMLTSLNEQGRPDEHGNVTFKRFISQRSQDAFRYDTEVLGKGDDEESVKGSVSADGDERTTICSRLISCPGC